MINSPWKSTALRQSKIDEILSELAVAKAVGGLVAESDAVVLVTPMAGKVPAFSLPITSEEYAARKLSSTDAVFIDGRSFMRKEQRSDVGAIITNQTQADFTVRLGELTSLWVKSPELRPDFLRVSDLAARTYISWIAGVASGKLGTDLDTSREIQIITGLFYIHQCYGPDEVLSKAGKDRSMAMIQRWTKHPIQTITDIVNNAPYMSLLEDYVTVLKGHFSSNTRVATLSPGLYTMTLNRSWFGFGAEQICCVAFEYPPAFLALVEAAANAKVWRKTSLGLKVQQLASSSDMEALSRSMETLAGQARGKDGAPDRRVSLEAYQSFNVSDEEIAEAEKALGVNFSPDYTAFLRTHGAASFGSHEIVGLGVEGHLNVVTQTLEFKKYLKPGRYVIENVGVDSVFIVADSAGKLYQASPTSEKSMNITFGQYLKDVMAGKR